MLPTEKAYGVIVVYKDTENLFLVLKQTNSYWTFPKGHYEDGETPKETALRELEEETGITEIDIIDTPLIHEEYVITKNNNKLLKIVEYFVGYVKDKKIVIQEDEIETYRWATYKKALEIFTESNRKGVLVQALKYLN